MTSALASRERPRATDGSDDFDFMTRRLLFENGGKCLENLLLAIDKHPEAAPMLRGLALAFAEHLSADGYTARAMVERLSPEVIGVLAKARGTLTAEQRDRFDKVMSGSSPQGWQAVTDVLAARALTDKAKKALGNASFVSARDAKDAVDVLMQAPSSAQLDLAVRHFAVLGGGASLNAMLRKLEDDNGSNPKHQLLSRLSESLTPDTGRVLLDVLDAHALGELTAGVDGAARQLLLDKLGGAAAVEARLSVLNDPARVKRAGHQLVDETKQVLYPLHEPRLVGVIAATHTAPHGEPRHMAETGEGMALQRPDLHRVL